jgi:hypothetical protein
MTLKNSASMLGVIETIDMELDMNLHDELVQEMLRKEFLEEVNTLRLQREAVRGITLFDQALALTSRWTILPGNLLCQRYQDFAPDSSNTSCQKC